MSASSSVFDVVLLHLLQLAQKRMCFGPYWIAKRWRLVGTLTFDVLWATRLHASHALLSFTNQIHDLRLTLALLETNHCNCAIVGTKISALLCTEVGAWRLAQEVVRSTPHGGPRLQCSSQQRTKK